MAHEDDATLPEAVDARRETALVIDKRYHLGELLGRGGMGEVRLARDARVERDVAVKLLRTDATNNEMESRFFREARVQGTLDHPAVVPVHDLGTDHEGQPYFVMKRLVGTTLHDLLAKPSPEFTQRVLLTRLVDVCLAIDFAHERGIVHRDLKPANIMLGSYGEAYVLDWGIARILDGTSPLGSIGTLTDETRTQAGALLGTPGYMSPEQALGEDVDARTDVFALGCVLFEILTRTPALPRGLAAIDATLNTKQHRPSERAQDIPPELDDLCARATAADRTLRPTARQFATSLQGYLDGDRDDARRRELAVVHVSRAQKALEEPGDRGRAIAMREAGRAFVLDPTNDVAKDLIASLTLTGPEQIPAAALEEANKERADTRRVVLRGAAAIFFGVAVCIALLFAFPVRHAWPLVFAIAACLVNGGITLWASRRTMPMMSPWYLVIALLNTVILIGSSYIFGPLLIIPIFICGSLTACLMVPVKFPAAPIIAFHVLAFAVPIATELLGITARTFTIENSRLTLEPYAVELSPGSFALVLILSLLAQIANASAIALVQRQVEARALDKVHNLSWHLRQLLPEETDVRGGPPTEHPTPERTNREGSLGVRSPS